MSLFSSNGGLEGPVGVIGFVDGKDRIIDQMERSEADEDNENLPHEGVPLEDKVQAPPHRLYSRVGIESGDDLGLAACVKVFVPKTGLTVWE